jgi:ribonuclease HII
MGRGPRRQKPSRVEPRAAMSMSRPVWWVGIDENGLGPRLGPLVATAVTLRVPPSLDVQRFASDARSAGVDDSKSNSAFSNMARTEHMVLSWLRESTGKSMDSVDDLWSSVLLTKADELQSWCPPTTKPQCWREALSVPAFSREGGLGRERRPSGLQQVFARHHVQLVRVRSAIACPAVLHRARDEGKTKFDVNLKLFQRLLLDARAATDAPLMARCGMNGGMRKYAPRLGAIAAQDQLCEALERKGCSSYRYEHLGEIHFEVDADATWPMVGLASMVGKYVRELWMERQYRFYAAHQPDAPRVSGYHDPVTARFVTQTDTLRRTLRIADECFERPS